jgi:hypothetical protein
VSALEELTCHRSDTGVESIEDVPFLRCDNDLASSELVGGHASPARGRRRIPFTRDEEGRLVDTHHNAEILGQLRTRPSATCAVVFRAHERAGVYSLRRGEWGVLAAEYGEVQSQGQSRDQFLPHLADGGLERFSVARGRPRQEPRNQSGCGG